MILKGVNEIPVSHLRFLNIEFYTFMMYYCYLLKINWKYADIFQLKHGIGADLIFFMLYLWYSRTVS